MSRYCGNLSYGAARPSLMVQRSRKICSNSGYIKKSESAFRSALIWEQRGHKEFAEKRLDDAIRYEEEGN